VKSLLAAVAAWEAFWWLRRRAMRGDFFAQARALATQLGKPLVVIGAPDGGVTAGYACGDVTIDLAATSSCPSYLSADITKHIPLEDNSCVIFVSCVLEYVSDEPAAMAELMRVSGGNLFIVRVEPWTLTSLFYPSAQRTISPNDVPAGVQLSEVRNGL
jgi:hypothetical protein